MKVVFYGHLADVIASELEIDASGCSIAQVRDKLIAQHPAAEGALGSQRARACIGDTFVHDDYLPASADTVEFLPPVSGG